MSLGAPQWLWGLLAIPLLVALYLLAEKRGEKRLREFVSARLLPQLAGTVNRFRRALRFGLQLLGLALALIALAQPRWGYTFQDVKRKGLDLLIAVDTSRSMLSNDVQPNRLERVKLAAQDLISELQGDRAGLIAFAGRAFLQAPLTIDYGAVVESINDLDTKTVPEGGTNISEAIALASRTFGKSAMGNRALILFTDGEELSGDAVKAAKAAADAGMRIFTVGVGTPQGSLIPINGEDGETAFVKDSAGQVVKSKLDENRLREIAEASGGIYLHLENGPSTMQQIYSEGLAKMQAAEFDVRLSRRPIERYEWPLGAALVALALSVLIRERKRARAPVRSHTPLKLAPMAAALVLLCFRNAAASAPGLQLYRDGNYADAYRSFQEDLQNHPDSSEKNTMQFDAGTAAYKMRDYDKALQAFSDALLSTDKGLQENSHFNMGRTLEERADMDKSDEDALSDLKNAQTHYEDTLKLDPANKAAEANLEAVKKKIERLKKHPKEKRPPPPQQQKEKKKNDSNQEQNGSNQSQQNQQQSQKDQQQQQNQSQNQQQQSQDRQSQNQSTSSQEQQSKNDKSEAKNQPQQSKQQNDRAKPGESPSPSPGQGKEQPSASPSPDEKKQNQPQPGNEGEQPSPTPGTGDNESPSPSPGNGEDTGENPTPSVTPSASPQKKLAGAVKGANEDKSQKPQEKTAEVAEAEPEKEGQMSERQAEALVQSMKDEEARVRLDERKAARHVYNDW
jgi:Ca-activated chloride channel family protein